MNNFIKKQQDQLDQQKLYTEKLIEISKEFPNIEETKTRWDSYLVSDLVNNLANEVIFTHSCGCCNDAALYAMPYIERLGIKIFSDPCQLWIGNKNFDSLGEIPAENWKEILQKNKFNEILISKVQEYLDKNPPINWENNQ